MPIEKTQTRDTVTAGLITNPKSTKKAASNR